MSGKSINSEQVKLYMKECKKAKTQERASAQCGFSERSGRRIDKGELRLSGVNKRDWRTRTDSYAKVWENEVVPLLRQESKLPTKTLFERFQKNHSGE